MDVNQGSSSLKHRFAKGFLRALKRIHNQYCGSNDQFSEISKRRRRVKVAANVAMASAVGSRKIWSQAVLWRIRKRARACRQQRLRRCGGRRAAVLFKRSSSTTTTSSGKKISIRGAREKISGKDIVGFGQEEKLRKLVPGGSAMDICSLLEETAHYIRCLTTQVKVMKTIADIYSSNTIN